MSEANSEMTARAGEKIRSNELLALREADGLETNESKRSKTRTVGPPRCAKGHPIMCDDTCEGKYCRWPSDMAYDWCTDQRSFEEADRRANGEASNGVEAKPSRNLES